MDDLIHVIPEKWRGTALVLLAASPYVGRAYTALAVGGGLRGILRSIWLGSATAAPKSDPKS